MNRKINVLGATYKIEEIKEQDKFMIDNNLCGYCEFYEKKIVALASDTTSEKELHEIDRLVSNTVTKNQRTIRKSRRNFINI